MLSIIRRDGSQVTNFVSSEHWKKSDASRELSAADFLSEPHHRFYGRPWIIGRYCFDQLLKLGLKRTDRVLDLGCGAGRIGIWLISYLDSNRYFGVDAHLGSLVAFATYEAFMHNLEKQKPVLMHDEQFSVEGFGEQFNVILDIHTTSWLQPSEAQECFARISRKCMPKARLVMDMAPKHGCCDLAKVGFKLIERMTVETPLIKDFPKSDWHIFQLTRAVAS